MVLIVGSRTWVKVFFEKQSSAKRRRRLPGGRERCNLLDMRNLPLRDKIDGHHGRQAAALLMNEWALLAGTGKGWPFVG
jgi:hypothetical protein